MSSLAEVLRELHRLYPRGQQFKASVIVERCRGLDLNEVTFKTNLEAAAGRALPHVTVQAVSARLRSCLDRPTLVDSTLLTLRFKNEHQGGWFFVETATAPRGQ